MTNADTGAGAFQALAKVSPLPRKVQGYQERVDQWEQERETYITLHGLEAWDRKVLRELRDLYPDVES